VTPPPCGAACRGSRSYPRRPGFFRDTTTARRPRRPSAASWPRTGSSCARASRSSARCGSGSGGRAARGAEAANSGGGAPVDRGGAAPGSSPASSARRGRSGGGVPSQEIGRHPPVIYGHPMAKSLLPRAALLVALLCTLAPRARAADADTARAEELIRQANALRQRGQDPAALPLVREAYDVARSPRTAAQLGLVELALGYWVSADDHLSEALAPASHPWIDRNRKVLQESQASARSHVGTLVIEGQPPGADVRVNFVRVGNFPLPASIRVGEGTVTIDVTASGHEDAKRTIMVRGGSTEKVRFDLVA